MRNLLVTVAITLGLTAGLPPAAYAGRLVHQDARRDVSMGVTSAGVDPEKYRARWVADPDIRRLAIDYNRTRLLVRVKQAAMSYRLRRFDSILVIAADGRRYRGQAAVIDKGKWQGRVEFGPDRGGSQCSDARHRFDYANDVSIWNIPVSCLPRARWVRVGVAAVRFAPRPQGQVTSFVDLGFRADARNDVPASAVISRRIWRG